MDDVALVHVFHAGADVVGYLVTLLLRDELEGVAPEHFFARIAHDRQQRVVDVGHRAIFVEENAFGGGGGELAHALFTVADRLFGAMMAGDVVDQHKGADLRSAAVEMRDQVDLDEAFFLSRHRHRPHILHPFAVERALDMRIDHVPGRLADRLAHGVAEDGLHGPAVAFRVLAIGEHAALGRLLVVGDGHRQIVGQRAQERLSMRIFGRGGF